MILASILFITLALLLIFSVLVISVTGAVGIVLFADVFVCMAIIIWLIRKFVMKK